MAKKPLSKSELLEKIRKLEDDPANLNPPGTFEKYKKSVRKRIDSLRHDVAYLISQERAAAGNPVLCSGWSGRQTNRR